MTHHLALSLVKATLGSRHLVPCSLLPFIDRLVPVHLLRILVCYALPSPFQMQAEIDSNSHFHMYVHFRTHFHANHHGHFECPSTSF